MSRSSEDEKILQDPTERLGCGELVETTHTAMLNQFRKTY